MGLEEKERKRRLYLLVIVDVGLKQVLGDEVVFHGIALLTPLGPGGVCGM